MTPHPTLRDQLRWVWRRLRGGELTPARVALSIGLGLLIGVQPLYGLHLPLCIVLCLSLRLDLVSTYLAANISIAPVAPFLLALEVEVGSLVLTGEHAAFSVARAREVGVAGFVGQAFLGSALLGGFLFGLGGAVTWVAARALRRPTPLSQAMARTIARYHDAKRGDRGYVAVKLGSDPVVALLANEGPLGRVVDAGAGRGQLGLLLLELGLCDTLTSFDWDARKVEVARGAARGDAVVEQASLTAWHWGEADTVLLVDVLHYLTTDEQDAVLVAAARSVAPGGRILVRDVDAGLGFRSWLTIAAERIGTGIRYNEGAHLCFRPASEIIAALTNSGLMCDKRSASAGTPLANVLIMATRPVGGGSREVPRSAPPGAATPNAAEAEPARFQPSGGRGSELTS